ncbi:uncharacterized protein LOC125659673 isoform X2 [Ostrea edulis]|uniref:uncharacterized protein LOC125659673 isoform X2 n=1 Tax=Ostrea edulis TaxID=37623 RepID=UPI002095B4F5|nr:uncharacterized protein LOC125659673 isoform X2 [Ostrea edulis]
MFQRCLVGLLTFALIFNCNVCSAVECNFDGTRTVKHFNETRFLGTWHELERTTFQWGDNTWHSQVWSLKRGGDGHLYLAYTGYSPQTQSCSSPQTGMLSGTGSSYIMTAEGRYEGRCKVPVPTIPVGK